MRPYCIYQVPGITAELVRLNSSVGLKSCSDDEAVDVSAGGR